MTKLLNLLSKARSVLTANRVAAIATWGAGLAAFIAGISGTLPVGWQNGALVLAGLVTKLVTALKFMDGSQKFDELQTRQPPAPAPQRVRARTTKAAR